MPECRLLASGHQVAVRDGFLIDPLCTGVAKIRLERWPRSDFPPACHARFNDRLRAMADGRHRFAGIEERFYESNLRLHAQLVWVDHTAGKQ
jgi:hypothetical protein